MNGRHREGSPFNSSFAHLPNVPASCLHTCFCSCLPTYLLLLIPAHLPSYPLTPTRFHPSGRKRYARALELLVQALSAPTLVSNAITLACYRKYVLVALIHSGERCYVQECRAVLFKEI